MKASYRSNFVGVDNLRVSNAGTFKQIEKLFAAKGGTWEEVFSSGPAFEFSGTYTTQQVTVDGVLCNLYALTTSGALTLRTKARVFLVGSGSSGSTDGYGGSGGFVTDAEINSGTYAAEIGAGGVDGANGNATRLLKAGAEVLTAKGGTCKGAGGSGGAGAQGKSGMSGQGVSTIPFGLTELYPHAAGGSSGHYDGGSSSTRYKGAVGGSNGANGNQSTAVSGNGGMSGQVGAAERGGGPGGKGNPKGDGGNATFYGSAGGGPGYGQTSVMSSSKSWGAPGAGYQGVAYVLQEVAS